MNKSQESDREAAVSGSQRRTAEAEAEEDEDDVVDFPLARKPLETVTAAALAYLDGTMTKETDFFLGGVAYCGSACMQIYAQNKTLLQNSKIENKTCESYSIIFNDCFVCLQY